MKCTDLGIRKPIFTDCGSFLALSASRATFKLPYKFGPWPCSARRTLELYARGGILCLTLSLSRTVSQTVSKKPTQMHLLSSRAINHSILRPMWSAIQVKAIPPWYEKGFTMIFVVYLGLNIAHRVTALSFLEIVVWMRSKPLEPRISHIQVLHLP